MLDNKLERTIYLYDLPKDRFTSVKLAELFKQLAGVELKEPIQFRDKKPHPVTGIASPFQNAIVLTDSVEERNKLLEKIKYFEVSENGDEQNKWQCRALPFDKDLLGSNKNLTNKQCNVFVKNIPQEVGVGELHKTFEETFGKEQKVKSAKISLSVK
jgi:hypothetical protein